MHSQQSVEADRRRRQRATQASDDDSRYRVLSFKQWCGQCGFGARTGRRILKSGDGPPVIQLSERRIGIRQTDALAWLEARVR